MHARKKIEIIVEAVRAEAVTLLLDRMGATGWTILPVLAGRGHQGIRRAGDPGGVDDNVLTAKSCHVELLSADTGEADSFPYFWHIGFSGCLESQLVLLQVYISLCEFLVV